MYNETGCLVNSTARQYMNTKHISIIALFIALMLFMPSIYIIFAAGGVLPPIFYLYFIIGSNGDITFTVIWLVHLLIYSAINLVISYLVIEFFIYKKSGQDKCIRFTFAVIAVLIMFSFLPIYAVGTHSTSKGVNIIGAYKSAGSVSSLP